MNFSSIVSKTFAPSELRDMFDRLIQEDIVARNPEQAAKKLYEAKPEQPSFQFEFSKK